MKYIQTIIVATLLFSNITHAQTPSKVETYTKECENSIMEGCLDLGILYQSGKEVPIDINKSIALFTKVCDASNAIGCYNLANLYAQSNTLDKNKKLASKYYQKACDTDYYPSCYNFGLMTFYYMPNTVENKKRGIKLFKKACHAGQIGEACEALARNYANGKFAPQSDNEARAYFTLACDYNVSQSCFVAGDFTRMGIGGKRDMNLSNALMKKGCSLGEDRACNALYMMRMQEKIPVLKKQLLLRNIIISNRGQTVEGASAFLVSHKGKDYAVSAKHLLGAGLGLEPTVLPSKFIQKIKSWKLHNFNKSQIFEIEKILEPNDNAKLDILIMSLKQDKTRSILTVAKEAPKVFDRLYIVGCPYEERGCQQNVYELIYKGKRRATQYMFDWVDKSISSRGFSGAPILNVKGEAVAVYTGYFEREGANIYLGQSIKDELLRIGL
jgi:hypothetical protein